ncbi:MAG TPA: CPBP family glutamic-type intramembrane protease [Polyangiaceae bacterium]|nr:CPBP family glutamic-type intramembrane protease [Polyangiaceae bacterium]
MRRTALVVAVIAAAMAFSFRPELATTPMMWLGLAIPYAALAGLAIHKMWDDGTLVDWLKPRWGDLSIGVLVAAVLLLSSWAARSLLAPAGSSRHAWLLRIYLQFGSAEVIQRSLLLTLVIVAIPVFEELVWRQLVLRELLDRFKTRRAWPLAALLYAAAHLPTVYTLRDPSAGLNPLLFVAALGCGIVWSFMAAMLGRLPPVIISHVAFTYFTATQFRLPGM